MKNQGISLITLIITIIVIIILAAIVIFTGLRTPDSAQFSAFTNDVDTVYTAMIDKYADLKVEHAVKGDYRTNEQIYLELATGYDAGQYAIMATDKVVIGTTAIATSDGTGCQNIVVEDKKLQGKVGSATTFSNVKDDDNNDFEGHHKLGSSFTLPKVREDRTSWYVTKDGKIFNSVGFVYNGNTYFNASYYHAGDDVTTDHNEARATEIAGKINSGADFKMTLSSSNLGAPASNP